MTSSHPKLEARHLRLLALVYIRQSTPQQLQNNQESTRRQYELAQRAQQMGWPATAIRVIDDDLGMSGAGSQNRAGFPSASSLPLAWARSASCWSPRCRVYLA
jgi:hypothetical protein